MTPALAALLSPRSVAILGASPRRRMASTVVANLCRFGFGGAIFPVHPGGEPVAGLPCFRSLADLPQTPDCVVIALSPDNSLAAFRDAVDRGVRAAVILGSGFAEAGDAGRLIQEEITRIARDAGVAVCGPNCLGLVTPRAGATLTGYHLPDDLRAGTVAAVTQSGSVFFTLAHNTRGIHFNYLISSGNEAVLTAADFLDAALDDHTTRLLVVFLEAVRDGERFLAVVERARSRGVPVVVLKVGRTDAARAAVVAHSGALAGSDEIFSAVCRQEGIIRVGTLDELYDVCEFLLADRLPRGDRVAVLTDSGGEKTLILDWGERAGLQFPAPSPESSARLRSILAPYVPVANPLDAWGAGDYEEVFPSALKILAADENVDVVALGTDLVRDTEEADVYARTMIDLQAATDKPIAVVTNQANGIDPEHAARLRAAGIPVLQGTEYGYRAIKAVADYARTIERRRRREPQEPPPPSVVADLRDELARGPRVIGEFRAKHLLRQFGIPTPREEFVTTLDDALAAADRLGYPVALKGQGTGLAHKTDVGAVHLDIRSAADLTTAWQAMTRRLLLSSAMAGFEGMLVQEMVPAGLEMLIGVTRDPAFGPIIGVGLGGIFVELLGDIVYARPPIGIDDALDMLGRLRGAALLNGFRGMGKRDVAATARAIVDVGQFVMAAGDAIAELDINPLIVLGEWEGVRAVDALIVIRDA